LSTNVFFIEEKQNNKKVVTTIPLDIEEFCNCLSKLILDDPTNVWEIGKKPNEIISNVFLCGVCILYILSINYIYTKKKSSILWMKK